MSDTSKKVILITGAASGFGKATALQLLEKGHLVYPTDINLDAMDDLRALGAHPLQMDVTNIADIEKGVAAIVADQGRIDVLVNNAGFAVYDLIESGDIERARKQFDVNFWGPAMLTRAVLPHMRAAKAGRIVNTASLAGRVAGPMTGWYSASKFAIEALSDALRIEAASFGVKVALIEPGSFSTGFGKVATSQFDQLKPAAEYKALVENYIASYRARRSSAPTPEPVVEAMLEAILSDSPKLRYVVGKDAEAVVKAKATLSDEEFDALVKREFGIKQ